PLPICPECGERVEDAGEPDPPRRPAPAHEQRKSERAIELSPKTHEARPPSASVPVQPEAGTTDGAGDTDGGAAKAAATEMAWRGHPWAAQLPRREAPAAGHLYWGVPGPTSNLQRWRLGPAIAA